MFDLTTHINSFLSSISCHKKNSAFTPRQADWSARSGAPTIRSVHAVKMRITPPVGKVMVAITGDGDHDAPGNPWARSPDAQKVRVVFAWYRPGQPVSAIVHPPTIASRRAESVPMMGLQLLARWNVQSFG
jgi:hypothetical protein